MDSYLAYIQWEDSIRPQSDWKFLPGTDEVADRWSQVVTCASVGWVVHETDRLIVLMPNLGMVGESVQGCGEIVIPKSCIIRTHRLHEPNLKKPK